VCMCVCESDMTYILVCMCVCESDMTYILLHHEIQNSTENLGSVCQTHQDWQSWCIGVDVQWKFSNFSGFISSSFPLR